MRDESRARLPDSELEVMLALWEAGGPVGRSYFDEKLRARGLAVTTINSYLSRLMERGFVRSERRGKGNVYTPLVSKEDYLARESRSFLERLCQNSVKNFVASLCRGGNLSRKDLDELDAYLAELKERPDPSDGTARGGSGLEG